ncbi:MAG: hypothetical protein M0Z67_13630 [Nitrospiraceae bacterium]|nr:hypothetical protein [Nitrospiraceae bacterium]
MSKRAGAYKSEKRKKELMRIKKQEEKRKRRLLKADGTPQDAEASGQEGETEQPEEEAKKEE